MASLTVVLLQLSRNRGNDKNLSPFFAPSQVAEYRQSKLRNNRKKTVGEG